jgi:RNA polymerase sigma-70 factor (ECF subfamily)
MSGGLRPGWSASFRHLPFSGQHLRPQAQLYVASVREKVTEDRRLGVSWLAPDGNTKCQMTERDFRQAFHDHKDAVYGFALRMTGSSATAEDVAQDCFVELLRNPGRFDSSRGSLRAFLLGITRNLVLKRWRTDRNTNGLDSLDEDRAGQLPDLTAGPISTVVSAAVQSLPLLQREALLLFEYEGFTLEEIANLVNADVGTVKSRLHRAREKLRQILAPLKAGAAKK